MTDEPDFSGPGPWTLPVTGYELARLEFGFPFDFIAGATGGRRFRVQLSGRFVFRDAEGHDHRLDPEHDPWEDFTVMFGLRHDKITQATVSADDAFLHVEFESGRTITVGPSDGYEGWEADGPGFSLGGSSGAGQAKPGR
jgi:Family of unknown function (DUF6188)